MTCTISEGNTSHSLLAQPTEIDIRDGHGRAGGKALRLCQGAKGKPFSKIPAWPSQAKSVVDSPGPAAE
jgi:hypothetical protein